MFGLEPKQMICLGNNYHSSEPHYLQPETRSRDQLVSTGAAASKARHGVAGSGRRLIDAALSLPLKAVTRAAAHGPAIHFRTIRVSIRGPHPAPHCTGHRPDRLAPHDFRHRLVRRARRAPVPKKTEPMGDERPGSRNRSGTDASYVVAHESRRSQSGSTVPSKRA